MSISTESIVEALKDTLNLSIQKTERPRPRSATFIQTDTGHSYSGASIVSDSSLFNITSEQVALIHAIQHNDFNISEMITLTEATTTSPISHKILKDYVSRVGHTFKYKLLNVGGEILFEVSDINKMLSEYTSMCEKFTYLKNRSYSDNHYDTIKEPKIEELRKYATHGMSLHFPSEEKGSRYGSVIATMSGEIFVGGAYGSPDKRLGLHAEMATFATAIMGRAKNITHIAVISQKYPEKPCPVCGHCRQFIAEMLDKTGGSPKIISLASESDSYSEHSLEELLPDRWVSKRW